MIIKDIKPELYDRIAGIRARIGTVYVFDPTGYGHRDDPYQGRMEDSAAQKLSSWLLHGDRDTKNGILIAVMLNIQYKLIPIRKN